MSKSVNTDEPEEPPFSDEEDFDAEEPDFDSGNLFLFPSWININFNILQSLKLQQMMKVVKFYICFSKK